MSPLTTKYAHPRSHLTFERRKELEASWNRKLRTSPGSLSIRSFAKYHGVSHSLWLRELERGGLGFKPAVRNLGKRKGTNPFVYCEYSARKAQEVADQLKGEKGVLMKTTSEVAAAISELILVGKMSPYCAYGKVKDRFPDKFVPSPRTIYNLINQGLLEAKRGSTPYHPGKSKAPRMQPHPAKTVPGRNKITERPEEADLRLETGHLEMDTVVSCADGKGGVLCLYDRKSRRYLVEKIPAISQKECLKAIHRLYDRGELEDVKSVTTDNGCEFLDQESLQRAFGCKVYYTKACASYEKGGIENCNRIFRRWFPKGTNFARVSKNELRRVEDIINNMPRKSLRGLTPNRVHKKLA